MRGKGVPQLGRILPAVAAMILILFATPSAALDPSLLITQFKHSRWIVDDGVPSGVAELAQGRDGYLWIGARDGLFRFDGLSFEKVAPRRAIKSRGSVSSVFVARNESVWVGYATGGAAVYRNGVLEDTGLRSPGPYVMRFAQSGDGAIWAMLGQLDSPLARYADGRWTMVGAAQGIPHEYMISILGARDGTLWIATLQSILILPKGASHFRRTSIVPTGHASLAQDSQGRVWMSDDAGTRVISPQAMIMPARLAYPTPKFPRATRTFFDKDGNLWGNNGRTGIFRISRPGAVPASRAEAAARVELFQTDKGLLSNEVRAMTEDREGNIWIGSVLGLERLRTANIIAEPALARLTTWGPDLLSAADGTIYVGHNDGVHRIRPGGRPEPWLANIGEVRAMCEGPDGAVWVVLEKKVLRIAQGRQTSIMLPPVSAVRFYGCAVDRNRSFWLSADTDGVFQLSAKGWRRIPAVGSGDAAIGTDRDGHILLMRNSNSLVRFDSPEKPPVTLAHSNQLQQIGEFHLRDHDILFTSLFGILKWRNGRVTSLSSARFPALSAVSGYLSLPSGDSWMMTREGIARVSTRDLEHALDNPNAPLRPTIFDIQDGLTGSYVRDGLNDVAIGGDGRIWFVTTAGVVWMDPSRISRNRLPPPVVISALKVGASVYRDPKSITLPAGTSKGEIDYAVPSLSIPQRVKVRYKLEGMDEDWVDPGLRRQMFFSNLGPGTYRFRVVATNNDGVWNRTGATLEFIIPPTFRQSALFKLLCACAAAIILGAAYYLHFRRATARLQGGMEVRLAERERIARELHDTLLQSFQGLILRFQIIANRMPREGQLRVMMDQALDGSDEVLIGVRNRVQDLRLAAGQNDLAAALMEVARNTSAPGKTAFQLTVEGMPRELHPIVREEIGSIGEEAIRNALRHAQAANVDVAIIYRLRHLRLSVRDNGSGLPDDVLASGGRVGHFGLTGMRERARQISASLTIVSRRDAGTEILLTIAGRAAYAGRKRWRWWQTSAGQERG